MSKELRIRDAHVFGLCAAAGLDPKIVKEIRITPDAVTFEVYMSPKQYAMSPKQYAGNGPLTSLITHPYC